MDFSPFLQPSTVYPAPGFDSGNSAIQPLWLAGPPYHSRPTRIFAWYGLPETASLDHPVPGIVLLHGRSGTAFAPWVKHWNSLGYAAIAVDLFGGHSTSDGSYVNLDAILTHEFSGPGPARRYQEIDCPPADQWPYHAVAAAMLGVSFLQQLPAVAPNQIGLTGISRGGFIAALVAGYDPRLQFVIPVYGCGAFNFPDGLTAHQIERYNALWSPDPVLPHAAMPILWLNGASDHSFDVKGWNHSASQAPNSYRSLRPRMAHSQEYGANLAVLPQFANCALQREVWPHYTSLELDNLQLTGHYVANVPIVKSEVVWTRASGCWNDCVFRAEPAQLDTVNSTITGSLPGRWQAAYLAMHDAHGQIHTSPVQFRTA